MKDRIALQIVEDALEDGRLQPGGLICEGTAGSTGVSLALVSVHMPRSLQRLFACCVCPLGMLAHKTASISAGVLQMVRVAMLLCCAGVQGVQLQMLHRNAKRCSHRES